jgi:hypothetical protein
MKWATEKPKEKGYYWLLPEKKIVQVVQYLDGNFEERAQILYPGSDYIGFLSNIIGLWAGPISEPDELCTEASRIFSDEEIKEMKKEKII